MNNIAVRSTYGKNSEHVLLYCKECKVTFTPTKDTPLFKAHLSEKTIRDIVSLSSQGMGVRGIAEHLEISPKAVNRNIIKVGELCAEQLAKTIVSLDLVEIQLDEFWSFVKKKRVETDHQTPGSPDEGAVWIWTAIDPNTRLLIAHHVGGHELEDCRILMSTLLSRLNGNLPLFVSDELVHYSTVLFELFHSETVVPLTGKRGRPRNPILTVNPNLNYATVKKTRKQGEIVKIDRKVIFGSIDNVYKLISQLTSHTINTSFVERTNLNWRNWDAHVTRKTLKFAKNIDYLKAKLNISIVKYNFLHPHTTLTKLAGRIPTTPAMAAKLIDHVWSILELIEKSYC